MTTHIHLKSLIDPHECIQHDQAFDSLEHNS